MVKPRLILVMGLPCSGKTTYAMSSRFAGFEYISKTKLGNQPDQLLSAILSAVDQRKSIIVDDDNITVKERAVFLDFFSEYAKHGRFAPEYIIECHHIATGIGQIVENGKRRQATGGLRLNKTRLVHRRNQLDLPDQKEGFHVITRVPFEDGGDTDCIHRAVFFSLPSVVYSARQHPMPTQPSDVRIFPDVDRVFVNGYKQGYLFIGIANLPMVATKQIAEAVVQECILQVIRQLTPPIDAVYYSPHLLSENHEHSLPHPYFAFKARDRFKINLEASVMVGCTRIDQQFAKNAGIGAYACRDTFFFGGDIQYEQTASPEEAIVELFKGCEPLT